MVILGPKYRGQSSSKLLRREHQSERRSTKVFESNSTGLGLCSLAFGQLVIAFDDIVFEHSLTTQRVL